VKKNHGRKNLRNGLREHARKGTSRGWYNVNTETPKRGAIQSFRLSIGQKRYKETANIILGR